ncbi:hypothetical protein [Bacteroides sp. 51]|uniref:hypothetical protein n=1 Tax=Bacteroides sp. 51 TaxID=2302938 RepID=UPI0013D4D936|nr:hypothetical protein [Bacteroides sp. 51]
MENIRFPSLANVFLYIKSNPCISPDAKELQRLVTLCDTLKEHDERKSHLYQDEISRSMMLTVCYEIAAMYQKNDPLPRQSFHKRIQRK